MVHMTDMCRIPFPLKIGGRHVCDSVRVCTVCTGRDLSGASQRPNWHSWSKVSKMYPYVVGSTTKYARNAR